MFVYLCEVWASRAFLWSESCHEGPVFESQNLGFSESLCYIFKDGLVSSQLSYHTKQVMENVYVRMGSQEFPLFRFMALMCMQAHSADL